MNAQAYSRYELLKHLEKAQVELLYADFECFEVQELQSHRDQIKFIKSLTNQLIHDIKTQNERATNA